VVVGGVFIAPLTKRTVGEGFYRMAHWTVRCDTGHCPVRQPRHQVVGFRPLELLTTRPPDRSCSLSSGPSGAALTSARAGAYCSVADERWRLEPLLKGKCAFGPFLKYFGD
jgi:hypothetical protein